MDEPFPGRVSSNRVWEPTLLGKSNVANMKIELHAFSKILDR